SVAAALPENYYPQEELLAQLGQQWGGSPQALARLGALHGRTGVGARHLALPREEYAKVRGFSARNKEYVRVATELGAQALSSALAEAEVAPTKLEHLLFVSVTGMATPSIDARLVNRLGLSPDLRRTPIFGLGCVAGAAGLARAADWAKAYPESYVALLAVELCSLTWQDDDLSVPNLIASSLFGDGAAAVVIAGAGLSARGPRIVASRSVFYPDTEEVMGWDIGSQGLRILLSAGVPDLVRQHVPADVDRFLSDQQLSRADVQHWILHTGGPKVLEAFQECLGLSARDLEFSWGQLRANGNLSSASVLMVLRDLWRERRPAPGERGLLMAMGPGFCSEMVLIEW
ncbi:MAG TPA: 3-oxoacyl-[acyl-carrier-protein] synthase III C-terminal domain-containing protein, partial [Polyangiaceae bacterium]|nr:3-oxoacyl-[acyl-carrier-protein] synthase III C-terminal domain-containing protein [Polyangiaceae bacterium]